MLLNCKLVALPAFSCLYISFYFKKTWLHPFGAIIGLLSKFLDFCAHVKFCKGLSEFKRLFQRIQIALQQVQYVKQTCCNLYFSVAMKTVVSFFSLTSFLPSFWGFQDLSHPKGFPGEEHIHKETCRKCIQSLSQAFMKMNCKSSCLCSWCAASSSGNAKTHTSPPRLISNGIADTDRWPQSFSPILFCALCPRRSIVSDGRRPLTEKPKLQLHSTIHKPCHCKHKAGSVEPFSQQRWQTGADNIYCFCSYYRGKGGGGRGQTNSITQTAPTVLNLVCLHYCLAKKRAKNAFASCNLSLGDSSHGLDLPRWSAGLIPAALELPLYATL